MIINKYVQQWCEDDYDVRKEDFYMDNAYYVVGRQWASNGLMHRLFGMLFFVLSWLWNINCDSTAPIIHACAITGILAICFWLHGILEFDANETGISGTVHKMGLVFFWILKQKLPFAGMVVLAMVGMCFYVKFGWIDPIKFNKTTRKKMEERIAEEEAEEEKEEQEAYKEWERGYKEYRYGLPEYDVPKDDPMLVEARKLFEGYTETLQMVKTRYRQLAKMYHPDKGGDTNFFQCVIEAYEELTQKLKNNTSSNYSDDNYYQYD